MPHSLSRRSSRAFIYACAVSVAVHGAGLLLGAQWSSCDTTRTTGAALATPLVLVAVNQGATTEPGAKAAGAALPRTARRTTQQTARQTHPVSASTQVSTSVVSTSAPHAISANHETTDEMAASEPPEPIERAQPADERQPDVTKVTDSTQRDGVDTPTRGTAMDNTENVEGYLNGSGYTSYVGLVRAKILAAKYYPLRAQQAGMQGVVTLGFFIAPTGDLQHVWVKHPARFALLTSAAMSAVRRAAPFPPFPPDAPREPMHLTTTLTFGLIDAP